MDSYVYLLYACNLNNVSFSNVLQPSQSGNFTVYLACDDGCDLWIQKVHETGLDVKEENDIGVEVPNMRMRKYTSHQQWDKYVYIGSESDLRSCEAYLFIVYLFILLFFYSLSTVHSYDLYHINFTYVYIFITCAPYALSLKYFCRYPSWIKQPIHSLATPLFFYHMFVINNTYP